MKNTARRFLPLALVVIAASLLGACQSASVTPAPLSRASVPTSAVKAVKTDMLGGLVGREAVSSYLDSRTPQTAATGTQAQADMRAYLIWQLAQRS
jgi:hypothetical protein